MGVSNDSNLKIYEGFRSAKVSREHIKEKLSKAREKAIFTGVRVIDDVFGGILPSDLVLVGAKTGVGKTGLMSQIALHNTMEKKKVFMYALEAEDSEIQMRILYERVVKKATSINPRAKYNFKHWRLGRYKDLECYYESCLAELNNFENFNIFYRKKEFGIDEFVKETMAIKNEADLIIVDHIHYFDFDGGTNENRALSDAIKKIRDIALITEVPIILVAHLRKAQGNNFKLVPDIDDFHGSSDLSKMCTKGVILASGGQTGDNVRTLFSFPKFRGFSTPSKFLFECAYDIYKNTYVDEYEVYKFKYNTIKFKFSENLVDKKELTWLG